MKRFQSSVVPGDQVSGLLCRFYTQLMLTCCDTYIIAHLKVLGTSYTYIVDDLEGETVDKSSDFQNASDTANDSAGELEGDTFDDLDDDLEGDTSDDHADDNDLVDNNIENANDSADNLVDDCADDTVDDCDNE